MVVRIWDGLKVHVNVNTYMYQVIINLYIHNICVHVCILVGIPHLIHRHVCKGMCPQYSVFHEIYT